MIFGWLKSWLFPTPAPVEPGQGKLPAATRRVPRHRCRTALADRLVEHRNAHHYTSQEVAAFLGIHTTTLGRWERGDDKPTPANLKKAAEFYGVTVSDLRRHKTPATSGPVGSRLKALRLAKGLTEGQVGRLLGKTALYVMDWETGLTKPHRSSILRLAQIYGSTPHYIRTGAA